jgi:hypothetical protein
MVLGAEEAAVDGQPADEGVRDQIMLLSAMSPALRELSPWITIARQQAQHSEAVQGCDRSQAKPADLRCASLLGRLKLE